MENDRVRVLDFKLRKGAKETSIRIPPTSSTFSPVSKSASPSRTARQVYGGTKTGDVLFSEAVTQRIGEYRRHRRARALSETENGRRAKDRCLEFGRFKPPHSHNVYPGKEGKEDELKRELLALSAPTRAEAGNIQYDLYQSPTKKTQFMRIEVWRHAQALEDHKATPHIKASFEKRQNKVGRRKSFLGNASRKTSNDRHAEVT